MTPDIRIISLPETGYVRLAQIIGDPEADPPIPAIFPIGRSTWWRWVATGYAPDPVKICKSTTAWKAEDIRALIERLDGNKEWVKGKIRRKRGPRA